MTTRKLVQQNETLPENCGRYLQSSERGASTASAAKTENVPQTESFMEAVVEAKTGSSLMIVDWFTVEIKTIALIFIRTAGYGTVRPVVWEDGGSNPASYPIRTNRAPNVGIPKECRMRSGTSIFYQERHSQAECV